MLGVLSVQTYNISSQILRIMKINNIQNLKCTVKIIMDKISTKSKGYALVEYTTEEAASIALKEMNDRKERDGVFLAFGIAGLSGRPTRRAISSVVERAPDNCVVVPGL
ncbi:hypothetical protein HN51_028789 [Arachis hypogaea]